VAGESRHPRRRATGRRDGEGETQPSGKHRKGVICRLLNPALLSSWCVPESFVMGDQRIIPPLPRARRREREMFAELPDAVSPVLWQDVRHVRDWAETDRDVRPELFSPASRGAVTRRAEARASAPELADALSTFAALKARPTDFDERRVAAACNAVVEWALSNDYIQTAIEWAEVAATVASTDPKLANSAGRITRNANEFDRSEIWFQRGIGLARTQGNDVEKFWGNAGYAKVCKELGRVKAARRYLNRAARIARKSGPPSLAAALHHELCAFLMLRGHLKEAETRARKALALYPKSEPRLPLFGADVALMLILARRYSLGARVARVVLRILDGQLPAARPAILALAARAFAGAGEQEEAAVHRSRSLKLLAKHPQYEALARWHLADALRLLGKWDAARAEAEMCVRTAERENDREMVRLIEATIRLIDDHRSDPARPASSWYREMVRELSEKLFRWTPRRGRDSGPWGLDRAA
jgi:tetratricopeptide (TPR) repeat protein